MKNIMKRAWELFKNTDGALFSECLKEAWRESKNNIETMLKNIISNSQLNDECKYEVEKNVWENYGKSRTYIQIKEFSYKLKRNLIYKFGYIDNKTNTYIAQENDATKVSVLDDCKKSYVNVFKRY